MKGEHLINDHYSVKEITDLGEFLRLRAQWDKLVSQETHKTFLCFDWFKIWLEHFLKNRKLLILLLFRDGEIVTIAPFLLDEVTYKGLEIKKIELIGNVYSPIRFFLFLTEDNGERKKNLAYIINFLLQRFTEWEILELHAIPEENSCFEVVKRAISDSGLKYSDYVSFGDWYLNDIDYSGDEYFSNLPQKIRKDILYCQRRLKTLGDFEFKVIKDFEIIDHYMSLYYEIYSKSWQKKETIGPIFHYDLAKMAAEKGWLRLGFLFVDGYPISSQFWITDNNTSFILKTVYDQEYKQYSPGKILTAKMMKYVIDIDQVKTIDYVHGDEPYKQDWTPKRRERKGLIVYNKNMKGQYLSLLNNKLLPIFNRYTFLKQAKEIITNHMRKN